MADPSISTFISNFHGGGARPNLYEVVLAFPVGGGSEKFSFTCVAASLPASNMQACIVPYMGRQVKLAGDREFEDWTVMVLNDTDFLVRDSFEQWSNMMTAHTGNVTAGGWNNPATYQRDAEVIQIDREGSKPLKSYFMESIFPTMIGEIQLGFDQNNEVERFQVTFAVNSWSANTTS